MKKIILLFVIQFFVFQIFSQEKCTEKETKLVDLNSINKCEITESKKDINTKEVSINNITIRSRRYLKKRESLIPRIASVSNALKTKNVTKVTPKENALTENKLKIVEEVISFNTIEEIPLFLSCKDASINKEACFNYEMEKHIIKHFIYPETALEREIEGDLEVSFIIDINGKVKDIHVKGQKKEHKVLKEEAKRIVSLLPDFLPGKHDGVKKEVEYSFPMSFKLD